VTEVGGGFIRRCSCVSDLRKALLQAHQTGQFLEGVSAALSRNREERRALASELAALHNERLVNVLEGFTGLKSRSKSGSDFFLVQVFGEVLPQLEASVREVIRCVLHLCREAGVDMVDMLDGFQEFCSKQDARPQEALAEIEANPDMLMDLLVPSLVAGSQVDASIYLDETIRLCQHQNVEFRRRALFALGRLILGDDTTRTDLALSTLERVVETDMDDRVLASGITSALALMRQDAANELRYVAVITCALSRGNECALHAASRLFGFHTSDVSPQLLQVLLDHLMQVKPTNKETLDNIDYGIAHLLRSDCVEAGLRFLESLLRSHPDELELFGDAMRAIRDNPALRSKVVTRWLLGGEAVLCAGVGSIVDLPMGGSPEIEADAAELAGAESVRFVFAARKVIGYLFRKPISAASFILSLMRQSPDAVVRSDLEALLLNPLLLNFSGSVAEYLTRRAESEEGEVKTSVIRALEALEEYLDGLRSVGDIPALHPSLEHRDAYRRHLSKEVARSFKNAQAQSVILQLVHKSVLLYGRKAIHHIFGPEGELNRMETQLGSHGTEIKFPRMASLDPQGLDYMLLAFKYEKISA
jgi:hypothetical protein